MHIWSTFWSSVPDSILLPLDWLLVWKVVNAMCNKLSFETIFSAGRCVPNPQEFCSFINFKIISLEQQIQTQWAKIWKKVLARIAFSKDLNQSFKKIRTEWLRIDLRSKEKKIKNFDFKSCNSTRAHIIHWLHYFFHFLTPCVSREKLAATKAICLK